MELTIETYLILLPLCFLAALVDSISGGGGLISLPAYTLVGLPYGLASGSNKFSACCGTLSSTIRFIRSGKILWLPAVFAAVGSLPGSWFGTWLSNQLSNEFMNMFMICAIPVVGVFMVLKKDVQAHPKPLTKLRLALCLLSGAVVGVYDGFFGPGTGTFLILLFTSLIGMDMVTASATAKPVNLVSSVCSLITRIAAGQVVFSLAIPAMFCAIAGAAIGSKLVLTKGAKFVRYMMLGVLALLVVTLAIEQFG